LDEYSRIKLSRKRYQSSEENTLLSTLNDQTYSKEEISKEIEQGSSVGENFVSLDLNYQDYYLSTFPEEVFWKEK